jgi:hypothetical protein
VVCCRRGRRGRRGRRRCRRRRHRCRRRRRRRCCHRRRRRHRHRRPSSVNLWSPEDFFFWFKIRIVSSRALWSRGWLRSSKGVRKELEERKEE